MGDNAYPAGDAVSIADLLMIPQMSFLWETEEGQDLLGPHPNLIAWIKRMEARPSLRNTQWDRLTELVGG